MLALDGSYCYNNFQLMRSVRTAWQLCLHEQIHGHWMDQTVSVSRAIAQITNTVGNYGVTDVQVA